MLRALHFRNKSAASTGMALGGGAGRNVAEKYDVNGNGAFAGCELSFSIFFVRGCFSLFRLSSPRFRRFFKFFFIKKLTLFSYFLTYSHSLTSSYHLILHLPGSTSTLLSFSLCLSPYLSPLPNG